MQLIDYWIGIPLCFLLSIYRRISALFSAPFSGKPQRVLFIELSEMGSSIIAHSAIQALRAENPNVEIFFLVFERNREGVDLLKAIPQENILSVRDGDFLSFAGDMFGMLAKLRALKIDTTIDLELFSRCTALIAFLSGAQIRVGFTNGLSEGLYRGSLLTHGVQYNHHQHMALNFIALAMALKSSAPDGILVKENLNRLLLPPPKMAIGPREQENAWALIRRANPAVVEGSPVVVLNPDPGLLALRGWPIERFAAVAERLVREDSKVCIAVVGLKRSAKISQEVGARIPKERFIDLCGQTKDLHALLSVIGVARAFLTNDSGPTHMATLVDTPNLVLFGPETPALYGPIGVNSKTFFAGLACSPCYAASNHRRSSCRDNKCLKAITVAEVARELARYL